MSGTLKVLDETDTYTDAEGFELGWGKCTDTEGLGSWNTRESEAGEKAAGEKNTETGSWGMRGGQTRCEVAVDAQEERDREREREAYIDNQQVPEGR